MKLSAIVVLALCALAHGRELKQTTVPQALQAAQGTRVSTLLAAVKAAGLTIPNDAAWTIFAPTNEAFNDDDIQEKTGFTAAQLLEPANKQALTQLLSYHVVPAGALRAAQLTDGQQLTTLLEGAAALRVDLDDDGVEIEVPEQGDDDGDSADVEVADIVAGRSIVHIIDEVLIPANLRRNSGAATGRRLQDDDGDDDGNDGDDDDNDDHNDGDDDGDDDDKKKL